LTWRRGKKPESFRYQSRPRTVANRCHLYQSCPRTVALFTSHVREPFHLQKHTSRRRQTRAGSKLTWRRGWKPASLHPPPYTLLIISRTLHRAPYALHHTPCTLHHTPYTLHPAPYTSRSGGPPLWVQGSGCYLAEEADEGRVEVDVEKGQEASLSPEQRQLQLRLRDAAHLRLQSGFRFSGFGLRISGFGLQVSVFGLRALGSGLRVSGSGLQVPGFEFRLSFFGFWGLEFSCFGFRVSSFGFRVSGQTHLLGSLMDVFKLKQCVCKLHQSERKDTSLDH